MKSTKKQMAHAPFLLLLVLFVLFDILTVFPLPVSAADSDYIFSSGAVLLDSSYTGKNILIQNGVFSVTVTGATDINIIFDGVTMDRRYASDTNGTVSGLYQVAGVLGWGSGGSYYAQTCPLLITGNSNVTVAFRGENYFYAGTNRCRVYSNDSYSKAKNGGGFAGIQVDAGSALTIAPSSGTIHAYGAFYVEGSNAENSSYGYSAPDGTTQNALAGGAGIGGGAAWNTTSSASQTYTAGTPGTIVINGGTVYAHGGHQAAGIGGGLNSAATATSITVNGGTVYAYGGRWAAGIGDGDSLQNDWTEKFTDTYHIVLNGGTVNAVGGVACPGIGTTDELSSGQSRSGTSGMEISLNGGKIISRSGYPDGFDPAGTGGYSGADAAAAIGAGNKSNMEFNSISVASSAEVIASGFGHYSITENGTDYTAVPTVNIDSDGYMFLGRFSELASSSERIFDLFEAQRFDVEIDGRIFQYAKYATQPSDGSTGEIYYYCPEAPEGKWLMKAEADGSIENASLVVLDSVAALEIETENLALTLWVDENSGRINEVAAPMHFRSIALSLPNPMEHGGIYALRVPTDSMYGYTGSMPLPKSGYAVITIDAREQGTLAGELVYPSKLNIRVDSVSETLIDLDVYRDGAYTDGRDGLIGDDFMVNVFAYTVYIEPDDETAHLYARYPVLDHVAVTLESFGMTAAQTEDGAECVVSGAVDMTGIREKTVRLKKTDSVTVDGKTVTLNSIVYKVTIVRKSVYRIELSRMDKVYDGNPVAPSIRRLYSADTGEDYLPGAEVQTPVEYTYYREESGWTLLGSRAPKEAGTYKVSAVIHADTYVAEAETDFTISRRPLSVSRIQNYLTYVSAAEYASWTAPHFLTNPGTLFLANVVGADEVSALAAQAFYHDISIGYGIEKITLTGVTLGGADADNYEIAETQTVFGQISYSLDGAIFRRKPGYPWDKFYPVDSLLPVNADTADYHSPSDDGVYNMHCDYVYARTANRGTDQSVYAVDIEFGTMHFSYSRSRWNTDSMTYEELEGESRWSGFDGENNRIVITNRSNCKVEYTPSCKIDFLHSAIGDSNVGIRANFYGENSSAGTPITGAAQTIAAASAGNEARFGVAAGARCYILLFGVPQLGDSESFTVVGNVTVTVSRTDE